MTYKKVDPNGPAPVESNPVYDAIARGESFNIKYANFGPYPGIRAESERKKPTAESAARDEVLDEAADFVDSLAEKARGTRSADALAMAAAEIRKQLKTQKPNTGLEG